MSSSLVSRLSASVGSLWLVNIDWTLLEVSNVASSKEPYLYRLSDTKYRVRLSSVLAVVVV